MMDDIFCCEKWRQFITNNLPPENMIKVTSTGNVFSKIINLDGKRLKLEFEPGIRLPKFNMCPYCGRMLLRTGDLGQVNENNN
jgi:hypothetical protein